MYNYIVISIIFLNRPVEADVGQFFTNIQSYFWGTQDVSTELDPDFNYRIPYELSPVDEKFIAEAAKLTGVELSRLDSCQHAVVLKLQTDCDKMNDEMVAKMAVALLNCQSLVEGRKMYPCTSAMSLKDCTTSMDADTWNTYHLMTNRVKAVCYSIRQIHFRGLTEQTINKLMHTSLTQLKSLGDIATKQENLKNLAVETMETLERKNSDLMQQHEDMSKAQMFNQLSLEDNINKLVDEKRLIYESQNDINLLTEQMRLKLQEAIEDMEKQAAERAENHQELVDDLLAIQKQANIIFQRIEESSKLLLQQTEAAQRHYRDTVAQLAAVNETMRAVVALISDSRQALEERLSWLASTVGGANLTLTRLQTISAHLGILFLGMVICAFLSVDVTTRLLLVIGVPLNLALNMFDFQSLEILYLLQLIAGSALAIRAIHTLVNRYLFQTSTCEPQQSIKSSTLETDSSQSSSLQQNGNVASASATSSTYINNNNSFTARLDSVHEDDAGGGGDYYRETNENYSVAGRPTPPRSYVNDFIVRSRSRTPALSTASTDSLCLGITRQGTPCKSKTSKGSNYCFRHEKGSSVLGS